MAKTILVSYMVHVFTHSGHGGNCGVGSEIGTELIVYFIHSFI